MAYIPGLPQWKGASAPTFDSALLQQAFRSQMEAAKGIGEAGALFEERRMKGRELDLKEQLQAAEIADYEAKRLGKGYYSKTGSGDGKTITNPFAAMFGNDSAVAPTSGQASATASEAAPAGDPVLDFRNALNSIDNIQFNAPESGAISGAVIDRPTAPTDKELPGLLAANDQKLSELNPTYGAALQAITGLTQQHDQIKANGGLVNPEVTNLQKALSEIRNQSVVPNAGQVTPEQVAAMNPEDLKIRANTLGLSAKYLEDQIAKAQGQAYASPELIEKRQQTANLAPIVEQEKEKALQLLNVRNNEIEAQRYAISKENEAARNEFLRQGSGTNGIISTGLGDSPLLNPAPDTVGGTYKLDQALGNAVTSTEAPKLTNLNRLAKTNNGPYVNKAVEILSQPLDKTNYRSAIMDVEQLDQEIDDELIKRIDPTNLANNSEMANEWYQQYRTEANRIRGGQWKDKDLQDFLKGVPKAYKEHLKEVKDGIKEDAATLTTRFTWAKEDKAEEEKRLLDIEKKTNDAYKIINDTAVSELIDDLDTEPSDVAEDSQLNAKKHLSSILGDPDISQIPSEQLKRFIFDSLQEHNIKEEGPFGLLEPDWDQNDFNNIFFQKLQSSGFIKEDKLTELKKSLLKVEETPTYQKKSLDTGRYRRALEND